MNIDSSSQIEKTGCEKFDLSIKEIDQEALGKIENFDEKPLGLNPKYFDYKINEAAPRLNLKVLQFEKLPFVHPARFGLLNNWIIDNEEFRAPAHFDSIIWLCFGLFNLTKGLRSNGLMIERLEIIYQDQNGKLNRIKNQTDLEAAYEWSREQNIEQLDLYVCKRYFPFTLEKLGEGSMEFIYNVITYNELRRIYTAHFIQNA